MKIKTSELTPQQLNAVVSNIEGHEANYATDWAHGGPIIEGERIAQWPDEEGGWLASANEGKGNDHHGPTPLIAAMRCFVASKLGDEIEVPEGVK